jgi:glucosamine--fructose-6-phosphate aminotransferase (isomerizing)
MCGIVGMIQGTPVAETLLVPLKRLEYRAYDSAGIATYDAGLLHVLKAAGKLQHLADKLDSQPLPGNIGIGHIRWATHGAPSERNAHPVATKRVAVVHNGIIENHRRLKQELIAKGCDFSTDTDTEVVTQYLDYHLGQGKTMIELMPTLLHTLEGAYALLILCRDEPEHLWLIRQGSPLVVAPGIAGSDSYALQGYATEVIYLEEGDWGAVSRDTVTLYDASNKPVTRPRKPMSAQEPPVERGPFPHFMLKEIAEQPESIARTIAAFAGGFTCPPSSPTQLILIACGSSYYAALAASYWIEAAAGITVRVELASEFRYRTPVILAGAWVICISQSGETVDTLAAVQMLKTHYTEIPVIALINMQDSSIARLADIVWHTPAGREIGVASTKAFTAQLVVLVMLGQHLADINNVPWSKLPTLMQEAYARRFLVEPLAGVIAAATSVLFVGRLTSYPMALEGALKLKEISYIHAEATPAGELKHGHLALVDSNMPVVVIAPDDAVFEKTLSNAQEIAARGGKILALVTSEAGKEAFADIALHVLVLPCDELLFAPLMIAVALQLLAYEVALCKGTDIDQPRNLAKSVTVE